MHPYAARPDGALLLRRATLGVGAMQRLPPASGPDGAGAHSYPTPPGAGAQPASDPARRRRPHPTPPGGFRPPPSTPRDGKWLEWGRRGAGIPCICHLSAYRRRRRPWVQALRAASRTAAPARSPTMTLPPPSAPRDGKWLECSRRGAGIPCICHLSAYRRRRRPWAQALARRLKACGARSVFPTTRAPSPPHREMANGWNELDAGPAYRAFAISRRREWAGSVASGEWAESVARRTHRSPPQQERVLRWPTERRPPAPR